MSGNNQKPIEICYAVLKDDGKTFDRIARLVMFDEQDMALNPIPPNTVKLTHEEFNELHSFMPDRQYINGKITIVPNTNPYSVPKTLIIERLSHVGLLRIAREKLKIDTLLNDLTDDEILLQEMWNSATQFMSNDPTVRAFLTRINANPDQILADPNLGIDIGSHA